LQTNHSTPNLLIEETSPYLLQHAYNPVEWHPWGETALQLAKDLDKPILVSIGYAACHWCHVMERESFEDLATAKIMNDHFVNIKIDREERPDLDHIYMDAVQAMTGSGGWPLNVFLTPDKKPFYGGTYFPPEPMHNRASWKDVLLGVSKGFKEKRDQIDAQADTLTQHLLKSNGFGFQNQNPDAGPALSDIDAAVAALLTQADTVWGGFGGAPKFPQTASIRFLLKYHYFNSTHKNSFTHANLCLEKMIEGGIYDQLGGGFSRYSTDGQWLAPHFEKMLYDNALLVTTLSEAYQCTKKESYLKAITETLGFVERELMDVDGGFLSALDADSEGVEGKFYTWSAPEIITLLKNDAPLFMAYYGVTEAGNWEHTNILHTPQPAALVAQSFGISESELLLTIQNCNAVLMVERNKRVRPQTDDKQLLGWNALMNTAFSKAYAATGNKNYLIRAQQNMSHLFECFKNSNGDGWLHTYKNGHAKTPAFLDDYAYLIEALIQLQMVSGDFHWLEKAGEITDYVNDHFMESDTGFYFYTHDAQADVILRKKEVYDGATPSGNAVMASNLFHLGVVYGSDKYLSLSKRTCSSLLPAITKHPGSFGVWASVLLLQLVGLREITLIGSGVRGYLEAVLPLYRPNNILNISENRLTSISSICKKIIDNQQVTFQICENNTCQLHQLTDFDSFLAIV
jgi:uncharacterized protein YyaL (SSP411 family)